MGITVDFRGTADQFQAATGPGDEVHDEGRGDDRLVEVGAAGVGLTGAAGVGAETGAERSEHLGTAAADSSPWSAGSQADSSGRRRRP